MNYIVEGNLNFLEELNNYNDDNDDDDSCLISGEKLEFNHVTLICGHKFNYNAIYNEVVYQKIGQGPSLADHRKLNLKELRCPYCRNIQNKLLPFNASYGKIIGVNYPVKHCMSLFKCKHETKSGKLCSKPCDELYCKKHLMLLKEKEENSKMRCICLTQKGLQCKNKGKLSTQGFICKIHSKQDLDKLKFIN